MSGKTNLSDLLKEMSPVLNKGNYVFVSVPHNTKIDFSQVIGSFKEGEGVTLILTKEEADRLNLVYDYVASWITLKVHSSLEAVGLTAAFSDALGQVNISCNVVAGYYHDHIFVGQGDSLKAMETLGELVHGEKKKQSLPLKRG